MCTHNMYIAYKGLDAVSPWSTDNCLAYAHTQSECTIIWYGEICVIVYFITACHDANHNIALRNRVYW